MSFTISKIFILFLLAFIFGIGIASFIDLSSGAFLISFFVLGAAGILLGFFDKKSSVYILLVLAILGGMTRFSLDAARRSQLSEFIRPNSSIVIHGYVDVQPQVSIKSQKVVFRAKEVLVDGYLMKVNDRILLTLETQPEFDFGDILELEAELETPKKIEEFNYPAYLAKDDIYVTAFFPKVLRVCPSGPECFKYVSLQDRAKINALKPVFKSSQRFQFFIRKVVSEPNASFINGLLTGSRSGMLDELSEAFRRTGTSHIFAISGWNITIIVQIVGGIFLIFFRRSIAFWFTLLVLCIFVVLTGASASIARAAIMGILLMLANKEGRIYNAANSIILAGAIMVMVNPKILRFDVGFQLSFLATLGLLYISPVFERYFIRIPDFFNLRSNFLATLSATVAILPLGLFYFREFSLISIPTNILVLPAIPWTMLLGFITGIAGMFSYNLGYFFSWFVWLFSSYGLWIIKRMSAMPFASVIFSISWLWVAAYYVLLILKVVRENRINKKYKQ